MGLFGKKKIVETPETRELNELLNIALEFNESTGSWTELPENVPSEKQQEVIAARKIIFEYIRQLKEAKFYSDGAVRKFSGDEYPWVNKQNLQKILNLGKML